MHRVQEDNKVYYVEGEEGLFWTLQETRQFYQIPFQKGEVGRPQIILFSTAGNFKSKRDIRK